jgi:hypothetical protein
MQDQAPNVARYQQIREAGKKVIGTLSERLSPDVLHEGGAKLGRVQRGKLVLHSEQEGPILMDFCMHDVRHQGLNEVERLLAEAPYPPGSDEALFLEALHQAWYSFFLVESLEPGVGIRVRDVIRGGDPFLIHDLSMSRTAVPGLLFASRLTAPDNIVMTTGTALPVGAGKGKIPPAQLEEMRVTLGRLLDPSQTPEKLSEGIAGIIRICLEMDVVERISYEDPGKPSRSSSRPAFPARQPVRSPGRAGHVGRNDPCPCGSGRKFKVCCGARR